MVRNTCRICTLCGLLALGLPDTSHGQVVFDLKTQWSNVSNPNGAWSYRHGASILPAVPSWQSTIGGWSVAQPGWAHSANGSDRFPFWFQSNGSETFTHDFMAGDVVVRSQDGFDPGGNASVTWTSPLSGYVSISGNTWLGRDVGNSNRWFIYRGATLLTFGDTFTGDSYSRLSPFDFVNGTGGASVLAAVSVNIGDTIRLEYFPTTVSGEFQGVNLTITKVPEPSSLILGLLPIVLAWQRRRPRRWFVSGRLTIGGHPTRQPSLPTNSASACHRPRAIRSGLLRCVGRGRLGGRRRRLRPRRPRFCGAALE